MIELVIVLNTAALLWFVVIAIVGVLNDDT
jgi:hypothetical protein